MKLFLEKDLGEISDREFAIALEAGDNYLETCKNKGKNPTMKDLLNVMADSIKRYRRVA